MRARSLILSSIAALISAAPALASAPSCDADRQPAAIDPVFKLELPESFYAAHFSSVPAALLEECGLTASHGDYAYRYWVFAAAEAGAKRYVILGGMRRAGGVWEADRFGSLDEIGAGKCSAISWPLDVFCTAGFGPPSGAVLDALAEDAVRRYATAFGSREKFIAELGRQGRVPEDPALKILARALDQPSPKN